MLKYLIVNYTKSFGTMTVQLATMRALRLTLRVKCSFSRIIRRFSEFRDAPPIKIANVLGAGELPESPVTVQGWVNALRIQKRHSFVDVNDGSCPDKLQIFLNSADTPDNLSWGSSVRVTGALSRTPKGQIELKAENFKVIGACPPHEGYPFVAGQNHPPEYLRQHLHLRPRTKFFSSVLRARDAATKAIHSHFESIDYLCVHAPILTSNDCEGAGEVFRVEPENADMRKSMEGEGLDPTVGYFGSKTFLTVSGQLHLEAATNATTGTYSFGPTFRAENSRSRLHLSEFYMVEAEKAFCDDLREIESLLETLIKSVTKSVLSKCIADIRILREDPSFETFDWLDKPFNSISYVDAIDLLRRNKDKFETPLSEAEGLNKEHELLLVKLMDNIPTFVTNWPKAMKPFYMRSLPDDPEKVAALDLLVPITGEVAGGSLREDSYENLKNKLPSDDLNWYLDLRKYGRTPTGGFGLGFERYLQFVCNVQNIKDTIPFPRWPHNCSM